MRAQYAGSDEQLVLSIGRADSQDAADERVSGRALDLLAVIPSGVVAMDPGLPGTVQTSTSLNVASTEDGLLTLASMTRSANAQALEDVVAGIESAARLVGAEVEIRRSYQPWRPDLDSRLLGVARSTSERLFGVVPVLEVTHGGLECAVIGGKLPGVEMISLGPEIVGPHAPGERLSIPATQRFYGLLGALLDDLSALTGPAATSGELRDVPERHAATPQSDDSALLLFTQDAVHRRPRGACHRGQIVLCKGNDGLAVNATVDRGELAESPAHPRVRIDVVRLDDAVARAANLLGEQPQEHVLHSRMAALKACEVVAEDRPCLSVLERRHRGGATLAREKERELSERLTRPEHVEQDTVSDL